MSWEMVKLDDCLEWITYGFTNPMPDADNGPWKVTAKDIIDGRINFDSARHTTQEAYEKDLTDKSRPIKDDLLLTKDGTLGRVALVGEETICINQSVALLRLKKDIIAPEYLLYLLQSSEYQGKMLADAGGSTIKHIYITKVNQMQIPLPPPETQRKLVDILQAYDKILDINQKQIKLLEEAAQRLYKEWFVDLRFPGHENTPIIDGVPQGWKKERLVDIADVVMGQSPKSEFYNQNSEGLPFHQGVGSYGSRFVVDDTYSTSYTRIALEGSILFSVRAPVGRLNITKNRIVIGRGLSAINHKNKHQSYLFYMLKERFFEDNLIGNGSIFASISKEELLNQVFLVPELECEKRFNIIVSSIDRQIEVLDERIKRLTEARDRLLPKLMSGELEV